MNPNKAVLPVYIKIYESVPNADLSLIDWGKAILEREEDLNKSVASYRKLISDFPEIILFVTNLLKPCSITKNMKQQKHSLKDFVLPQKMLKILRYLINILK